jgi:hypothetical protein
LTFLVHRYTARPRDDIRVLLESALARALAPGTTDLPIPDRAEWLRFLAAATIVSDDERLGAAAATLAASLCATWSVEGEHCERLRGIEMCLDACDTFDAENVVRQAIDALEQVIASTYRPGAGLGQADAPDAPRRLALQVRGTAALLAAFERTGRLAYPMLAEELMQFARRSWWDRDRGGFADPAAPDTLLEINCDAVAALCRLDTLRDDPDYHSVVPAAPEADYRRGAELTLNAVAPAATGQLGAAVYGLALERWLITCESHINRR